MKVTIISDIPLSRKNGTAVAAANLIESLRAKGHEVRVVCPDKDKKGKEGYYVAETRSFGPFDGYVKKNDVALAKADDDILYSAIDGADIVHCMMPFSLSRRAADIARALGIPVSAGFHCQAENVTNHLGLMNSKALNKAIYRRFYRVLYGKCDCVHYPTVFIKDEFESSVKKSTRGYVISNGVDEAFFKGERKARTDGKFVILCTGRYSREKDQSVLIDAVKKSAHEKDIQLVFAGAGPMEGALRRRAEGLTNAPVFGFFTREELTDVIHSADLYVHTAKVEIEAISCLEAICGGLVPVIADSEKSATRAFAMGGHNLFRPSNSADLAEKIDFFMENPYEKEKCALLYKGFAAGLAKSRCMDEMENMLAETVLENKRAAYGIPVTENSQRASVLGYTDGGGR